MSVQACLPADTLRRLGSQPVGLQEDDDITSEVSEFSSHQDQSFDWSDWDQSMLLHGVVLDAPDTPSLVNGGAVSNRHPGAFHD